MTLTRRGFLGALPIASLALASSRAQAQYASTVTAAPVTTPPPSPDYATLVQLSGDALPRNPMAEPARLQALFERHAKPLDSYLAGGAVAELEAKFSLLLGKEDTVFMPTGTLANHIAMRLLCGESKHALVQQESHVRMGRGSSPKNGHKLSHWARPQRAEGQVRKTDTSSA